MTVEIEELKRLVEAKHGKPIRTSTDFDEFSLLLAKNMHSNLSSSTLKRLWNYVNDSHKPRIATLDILAQYIGHQDFNKYSQWLKTSQKYNSSFFNARQLMSAEIERGSQIEIGWSPNRLLRLHYHGENIYEIVEAKNSKLMVGDRFLTGCFIKQYPLFLPYIERQGERMPSFVAGRNGGLTIVNKLDDERGRNK